MTVTAAGVLAKLLTIVIFTFIYYYILVFAGVDVGLAIILAVISVNIANVRLDMQYKK